MRVLPFAKEAMAVLGSLRLPCHAQMTDPQWSFFAVLLDTTGRYVGILESHSSVWGRSIVAATFDVLIAAFVLNTKRDTILAEAEVLLIIEKGGGGEGCTVQLRAFRGARGTRVIFFTWYFVHHVSCSHGLWSRSPFLVCSCLGLIAWRTSFLCFFIFGMQR